MASGSPIRRLWKRWLGPDPALHPRFAQQALASLFFAQSGVVAGGLLAIMGEPAPIWLGLLAAELACALGFAWWVRTGRSAALADPQMLAVQIMAGSLLAACIYLLVGPYRGLVFGPLMLALAFAVFQLNRTDTLRVIVFAWLVMAGAAAFATWRWPARFPWPEELLHLVVLTMCVPGIGFLGVFMSGVRTRLDEQQRALQQALVQIEHLATHDGLTALPNRRHGEQVLAQGLLQYQRLHVPLAVALIDLDHFKRINDAHGHAVGDAVLRRFAALGQTALRRTDVLVRWGGEEFLLLVIGMEPEPALKRLQEAVRKNQEPLPFAFSAGVASARPDDLPADLIERADQALYRAKAQGRDRIAQG